jgi:hypothetical protein
MDDNRWLPIVVSKDMIESDQDDSIKLIGMSFVVQHLLKVYKQH